MNIQTSYTFLPNNVCLPRFRIVGNAENQKKFIIASDDRYGAIAADLLTGNTRFVRQFFFLVFNAGTYATGYEKFSCGIL